MKRIVTGTSGLTTSKEYIKCALFDYMADELDIEIEGRPLERLVEDIKALAPIYDINDVLMYKYDNNISLRQAIKALKDEIDTM